MKTINIQRIIRYSCILFFTTSLLLLPNLGFAQFNMSGMGKKIQKDVEKKVDKKVNDTEKKIEKPTDIKIGTTTKPAVTKTETTTTKSTTSNTSSGSSMEVPSSSPAYNTWKNKYVRNIRLAKEKKEAGNLDQFRSYISYAEASLKDMKKEDPSLNMSAFESEIAALESEFEGATEAAENLVQQADKLNAYVYSKSEDFNELTQAEGKEFYEMASNFHIDSVYQAIEAVNGYGSSKMFKEELDEFVSEANLSEILDNAKKIAAESYVTLKQNNTFKAIKQAEDAQGFCKGVLKLMPNNQKAKDLLAFVDKAYDNATATVAKTYTGDFHKKHINQIVWSTKKITAGSESESDVMTAFKSGQTIYGTAYFSDKLINRLREGNSKLYLTFKIDGNEVAFYSTDTYKFTTDDEAFVYVSDDAKQKSYIQFALVPALPYDFSEDVKVNNKGILFFNKMISDKGPMSYKITVTSEFSKSKEKVEGSFDYDISDGTEQNEKIFKTVDDLFVDAARLPAAKMSNSSLVTEMTALANKYPEKDGEKYSNGRITSSEWTIIKNSLGIILNRKIGAAFAVTLPDGHCEIALKTFGQDYVGGGAYGKLSIYDEMYTRKRIRCTNINK